MSTRINIDANGFIALKQQADKVASLNQKSAVSKSEDASVTKKVVRSAAETQPVAAQRSSPVTTPSAGRSAAETQPPSAQRSSPVTTPSAGPNERKRNGVPSNKLTREVSAQRGSPARYWILATKSWWLAQRTFGLTPRASATSINDVTVQVLVQIVGQGSSTSYITGAYGGDSSTDLLNGLDPSENTFYTLPYLPSGATAPSSPFIDQMGGPRRAVPDSSPGVANYYEENYTALSVYQLIIRSGSGVTFYKAFFNVVLETLEPTQIFFATQPRKLTIGSPPPTTTEAKYHARTLDGQDTSLFDVNHAYLCGKLEFASNTIKPINTNNTIDVFIRSGRDRTGSYRIGVDSVSSRFNVGDVVYWLYGDLSRLATVNSIESGTFVYVTREASESFPEETVTFSGVRVRMTLSEDLSGFAYARYFATQIIATFTSVESALSSSDSFWNDTLDQLGGFANEWVVQRIEGSTVALPSTSATYIADTDIFYDFMDCSKAGKAYFVQSSLIVRDQPEWNNQENYHDGDVVAQRPRLGPGDNTAFTARYVRAVFFEFDCKKNGITRTVSSIFSVPDLTLASFYPNLPDWFPSKRYRLAGWTGELNLNSQEREASRVRREYDSEIAGYRQYLRTWPLNTASIEDRVASLQSEEDYTEIEITDSYPAEPDSVAIGDEEGPTRWGYTFTTDNYISA